MSQNEAATKPKPAEYIEDQISKTNVKMLT